MAYYSVVILYERGQNQRGSLEYESETVYFGEDETMMRVKFFDAVRKASTEPEAISVKVWRDVEMLVQVKITH